jgi:hypothetical protein
MVLGLGAESDLLAPATLTLPYFDAGSSPDVFRLDNGGWTKVTADKVDDTVTQKVSVEIGKLGVFAAFSGAVLNGGDPPIYRNIMAFPTPERFIGEDLNGDGDANDTVLRYMNLETGEVVNTGLIASGTHHAMDIHENVIAFVGAGGRIRYYDINTSTVGDTGANGSRSSIYGNIIAFASGGTIRYFDLNSQTLVDTRIPGSSPAIYEDLIVFQLHGAPTASPRAAVGSPAIYQDMIMFDASSPQSATGTHKLWTYDLGTGAVADTGIVGRDAAVHENVVAFVTPESSVAEDLNGDGDTNDLVIRYYDLAKQTVVNTGAVGRYPALYGSRIAFATRERAVNQDLSGDGMIAGYAIRYYDLETGQVVNTHELGTEPDIYDDTITFYLWEDWVALDLNGDGDQGDPIVGSFTVLDFSHNPVGFPNENLSSVRSGRGRPPLR